MSTQFIVIAYTVYLPISIGLTLFVARYLFKNGRVFMLDIFHGKEDIAFSTNRLFEMGFYLLNIGFALIILKMSTEPKSAQETIEALSKKLGGFSIYLGIMLFVNLLLFFRGRRKSRDNERNKNITHIPNAPNR